MSSILIYSPVVGPRLRYIMTEMLVRMSGLQIEFCTDAAIFRQSAVLRINYSCHAVSEEEIHILPHGLLEETGVLHQQSLMNHIAQGISFSHDLARQIACGEKVFEIQFDLFAAAFFLLSRYEEYLPFKADIHGRYSASESVAFRSRFLERPLVQEWAFAFTALLKQRYAPLKSELPPYRKQMTIDVDQAFKYRHKPWWRNFGGFLRDPASFRERFAVLTGLQTDPYDIFDHLEKYFPGKDFGLSFFFLLGDYGAYDKNTDYRNTAFRNLITKLGSKYPVGIHPSYTSNSSDAYTSQQILLKEVARLESILGAPVKRSRQHYLKLRFPETYRKLLNAGITHDFTMGYADRIGFRASTALPFYWYDLENEVVTELLIHPFQVMDVTLRHYLRMTPEQARLAVRDIRVQVEKYGGDFTCIWHNSSFDQSWQGWSPDF